MFRRTNTAEKPAAEEWPGLGTWFEDSHSCPECRPFMESGTHPDSQPKAPPEPERPDPPGLGTWYRTSEACPECAPFLEEQAKTVARAKSRPTAPQKALIKARQRAIEQNAEIGILDDPAPELHRFEWDFPEDHEMSTGGKIIWRVTIWGFVAAIPVTLLVLSPFPPLDTAKHYVAAAGCQFGELVDVVPARAGEPGYHPSLDKDNDGIACEPERAFRSRTSGGSIFIRAPGS